MLLSHCQDRSEVFCGIEGFPPSLDPVKNFDLYTTQITNQIYETLVTLDNDYKTVIPNLATRWQLSDDGLVYKFLLRDDVHFHNHSKLLALDIENSINRYVRNRPSWMLADKIKNVTVIDSLSIEITLERPYSQFLYMLCSPYVLLVTKIDKSQDSSSIPYGTGPFIQDEIIENKKIVLKRNINYWKKRGPVERISFIVHNTTEERQTAMVEKEVDILFLISGSEIDRLRWTGNIDYLVLKSRGVLFFGFNLANKPFDDLRVRRAVLHALNLPKIVHNLHRGNALVATGPLPPAYPLNHGYQQSGYDPEKAVSLLKEAGYPNGIRVKCIFPGSAISRTTIVEIVKSELEKSGIFIDEILTDSWEAQTDSVFSENAQLFFDGSESMFIGEPEYFLHTLFYSESRFNFFRYKNDRVDLLLEMVKEESDKSKRDAAYELIVKHIINDTPAVFYSHVIPHFAYNSIKIKEMYVNPYTIVNFHRMELYE